MSVPTHNLYEFIHQTLEKKFFITYFSPWGEKDLAKTVSLFQSSDNMFTGIDQKHQVVRKIFPEHMITDIMVHWYQPFLFCHDQEPLNFDLYSDNSELTQTKIKKYKDILHYPIKNRNLRYAANSSFQKYWILLHSELNSIELEKYEKTGEYIGAYWWSHAMISRDWYRYAEHDPILLLKKPEKTFLIYCRDSTGSRKYRTKFLNNIVELENHCQIGSFNSHNVNSDASAIYNAEDFVKTMISVVLETVFDERIHLTEKTLRPIACGHPFILAAGPGSLKYLQSHGFKTFEPWIDESYDSVTDNIKRLNMIVSECTRIANLDKSSKISMIQEMQSTVEHNKQLFFSKTFYNSIVDELKYNVQSAYNKTNNLLNVDIMWETRKIKKQKSINLLRTEEQLAFRPYVLTLIRHLKKGGTLENYVPPDLD